MNFSSALHAQDSTKKKVLEIGSGLSTFVFSWLIKHYKNSKLISIDSNGEKSLIKNSRFKINQDLLDDKKIEIVKGNSIDIEELNSFYDSPTSTLGNINHENLLKNIDNFIDVSMDGRKEKKCINIISKGSKKRILNHRALKSYLLRNGMFSSNLFKSYRYDGDEFDFLSESKTEKVLKNVLESFKPNLIYLDTGEFSANLEFNLINKLAEPGTILLVQDILFPKSIKSFLISSFLLTTKRWKVIWIDKTTPQGIIMAIKK
jgi:hypothetical protein